MRLCISRWLRIPPEQVSFYATCDDEATIDTHDKFLSKPALDSLVKTLRLASTRERDDDTFLWTRNN